MLAWKYFKYFSFTLRHSLRFVQCCSLAWKTLNVSAHCCSCECWKWNFPFAVFPFNVYNFFQSFFTPKAWTQMLQATDGNNTLKNENRSEKKKTENYFQMKKRNEGKISTVWFCWGFSLCSVTFLNPLSFHQSSFLPLNKKKKKTWTINTERKFQVIVKIKWKFASCWFSVPLFSSSRFCLFFSPVN